MIYNYDRNKLAFTRVDDRDPDVLIVPETLRIEWQDIGEGYVGDYNPKDPDDMPLLRFYVSLWRRDVDDIPIHGDWEDADDGSYCTNMPVSATPNQRSAALYYIAQRIIDLVDNHWPLKKTLEKLSWIAPDWLTLASS